MKKGKINGGIVGSIVSIIFGSGGIVAGLIFLIVTVFAAIGLAAYEKGSEAWEAQNKIVMRYEILAYVFGIFGIILLVLGIVLLIVFLRKKHMLKKKETPNSILQK